MAWSDAPTLLDRFEQARHALGRRRRTKTYNGYSKTLRAHHADLQARLRPALRQRLQALASKHWLFEGYCCIAVDGSQIDCPRTKANLIGLDTRGKDPLGPSLYVTTAWHVASRLPWDWRVGPARSSEPQQVLEMLADLPQQALLLMDAGLRGYELLRAILGSGRHVLVRAGRHVHLLKELGWDIQQQDDTVYLWPSGQRSQAPLALHLIRVGRGKKRMWLLSDLPLTAEQAGRLYAARWGIETHHRSLKQTLERRKMLSRGPDLARIELDWTMLGLQLLGLLGVQRVVARRQSPRRLSVAQTLRALRRALEGRQVGRLSVHLGHAVKDSYRRQRPKQSRDYPAKKRKAPPGKPHIRKATCAERQRAQRIVQREAAG
jgi:hypothetical protein